MRIEVRLLVSQESRGLAVSPAYFDLTDEQWMSLSRQRQKELIENYVEELEQPFWEVDKFEEVK